jgi:hypothetical protein
MPDLFDPSCCDAMRVLPYLPLTATAETDIFLPYSIKKRFDACSSEH